MAKEIQVYEDKRGEWRWRLVELQNCRIMADSGQGYFTKQGVLRAIDVVRDAMPAAPVRHIV
jgi:uncharacterized protein YegP (UPF0339 family)